MHKLPKLAATLLACAIVSAPAHSADKAAKGNAVAIVNGTAISQTAFDSVYAEQRAQGLPDGAEVRAALREEMIRRELLAQEAKKAGLDKTPAVAAQIDLARQAVLIRAYVQDFLRKNPISDAQLKAEYDLLKTKIGGTELKVRHILVETEAEAAAIIESLKKGEKFEDLAKQSKDPGSRETGGDLGWAAPGTYVQPFAEALNKLQKGQTTEAPVKSDFGWHVIQLDDSRPLEAPAFETIKPQLAQRASQQLVEKMINDLRTKAKVQ